MQTKQGCQRPDPELQRAPASRPTPSTATRPARPHQALDTPSATARTTHALIATDVAARGLDIDDLSPTSSTTTCRARKITCTASAAPAARQAGQCDLAGQRARGRLPGRYREADQAADRAGRGPQFRTGAGYEHPPGNKRRRSSHRRSRHRSPSAPSVRNARHMGIAVRRAATDDRRRRLRLQQAPTRTRAARRFADSPGRRPRPTRNKPKWPSQRCSAVSASALDHCRRR